jgi:hypothetical protein
VIASRAANHHERTAKMLTYLSALLPDTSWPFWPHFWLLSVSILASFAVAAGIIFEASEYSASTHRVAKWLVIGGVAIEAACTVSLFAFDERISGAQQSTIQDQQAEIISLKKSNDFLLSQEQEIEILAIRARRESAQAVERAAQLEKDAAVARASVAEANARTAEAQLALEKLKTPRTLGPARQQAIAKAIRSFAGQRYRAAISQGADDGVAFWESIYATLESAGWTYVSAGPPSVGNPPAGIPIAAIPGVEIRFDPAKEKELGPSALALGNALHADGTVVAVNSERQSNANEAEQNIFLIVIGARVAPP